MNSEIQNFIFDIIFLTNHFKLNSNYYKRSFSDHMNHRKNFKDVSIDMRQKIKLKCLKKLQTKREEKQNEFRKQEEKNNEYIEIIQKEFIDENIILTIEEMYELEKELKIEEELILKEYEKNLKFEQDYLEQYVGNMFFEKNK